LDFPLAAFLPGGLGEFVIPDSRFQIPEQGSKTGIGNRESGIRNQMEGVMEHSDAHAHIVPSRTFVRVWLLLTAVLVAASRLWHQALSVWAMLVLTPVKAGLVLFYFMHLKYEKPYLRALVFLTFGILTLVIGLLFFDILYR
jgi:cytochrome c oxidase subunit 4